MSCILDMTLAVLCSLPFCVVERGVARGQRSNYSHRKEEGGALREEYECKCRRETGEGAENDVDPPCLHRHGTYVAVGGATELTNHNPGKQSSKEGAQNPEGC